MYDILRYTISVWWLIPNDTGFPWWSQSLTIKLDVPLTMWSPKNLKLFLPLLQQNPLTDHLPCTKFL